MCHVDAYATLNAFLGNCTATRHHVSENSQIIHVSTSYVQPIHLAVIYIQHTLESHIVVHKILLYMYKGVLNNIYMHIIL